MKAHDSRCYAPLSQWLDLSRRNAYTLFDDRGSGGTVRKLKEPSLLGGWLAEFVLVLLFGFIQSISFLLVSRFAPSGYTGSSGTDNALCAVGFAIACIPIAHMFAYWDQQLSSLSWTVFWSVYELVIWVGLRLLVEFASGRRAELTLVYVLITILVYPALVPFPQVVQRIRGIEDWYHPRRLFNYLECLRIPFNEFVAIPIFMVGIILVATYIFIDAFIFTEISGIIWNQSVRTVLRPIAFYLAKRTCYAAMCFALGRTSCISAKLNGLFTGHIILSLCTARMATGSNSWASVALVVGMDWLIFFFRSIVYWWVSEPPSKSVTSDMSISATRRADAEVVMKINGFKKLIVDVMSFDKVKPGSGIRLAEYRGFEYMVENFALSISYCAYLLSYVWLTALGLQSTAEKCAGVAGECEGDVAFDFWFPYGIQSLQYLLMMAGADFVQDFFAHAITCISNKRWGEDSCHYRKLFVGWLSSPKDLVQAAMSVAAAMWVVPFLTSLAFGLKEFARDAGNITYNL